jgi:hypothetical protein
MISHDGGRLYQVRVWGNEAAYMSGNTILP